jgi:hypothetical protein
MKIFNFISDLFLKVYRVLKPIFLAVFDKVFQELIVILADVAKEAIKKAAATDLNNDAKRNLALNEVKEYAIKRCLTVSDSQILLIIQIMFNLMKKKKEV